MNAYSKKDFPVSDVRRYLKSGPTILVSTNKISENKQIFEEKNKNSILHTVTKKH